MKLKEGDRVNFPNNKGAKDVPINSRAYILKIYGTRCDVKWDTETIGNDRGGHNWSLSNFKLLSWKSRFNKR